MNNKILYDKYYIAMNIYQARDIENFIQGKVFKNFHLFAEFFALAYNKPVVANYFSKRFSLF